MEKLKVLMLDLKSYYPSPPYQLGLLVAYACAQKKIKENMEFVFSEHNRETPASEVAEAVFKAEADMIAISDYAWNHKKICDTLNLLAKAKTKLPLIVLGGPNCSGKLGEVILAQYPIVAALVEGEGEPAFADICASLVDNPQKNPFSEARNCTIRGESGQVIRPNIGHRIGALDEIPSPYLTGILAPAPSPIFYETNRGCPYRCSFCYWGNGNSKVYRMSVERVKEEMEFFAKNRVRAFWLADANFGIFPSDSDIAEAIAEINARYGYPFRSVGVNWAKNSSDRVLEIAEIFHKGRISCSTTIALQTVTAKAEEYSKRYSMPPIKFMSLLKNAHKKNIDTYTDIILGLPGESLHDFINGLDTVATTAVPSIKIHQLVLIPGTEFFDNKEELGLETNPESIAVEVVEEEKSDYYDCTVISHPLMSSDEMVRGRYMMGIVHLLHNHNLGQMVNHYLSRYDISSKKVFLFMEELLLGSSPYFPEEAHITLLEKLRTLFHYYTNKFGVDDNQFIMSLSFKLWFKEGASGLRDVNEPNIRAFMHDFYTALCTKYDCCHTPDEKGLLRAVVDYNVLISPKPTWRPEPEYQFTYDVHQIWQDILRVVMDTTDVLTPVKSAKSDKENLWNELPVLIRKRIKVLLTDDYLNSKKKATTLWVENPWGIPPSMKSIDWLVNSRSKHCIIMTKNSSQAKHDILV
ncbi:MAG: radical SAM superfamily enzyme YgiQ (UPF0313 family) [Saprospiraceae bacterium]|jgi:radical SAM superfamily enzyme YgiQ (UPF0313 family)